MATFVSFHAHPDDEAIGTGGSLAKAAADGHRVVLVTATRGEHGQRPEGVLEPGEELWQRRVEETAEAARILGVHRIEFLGYHDSGMMGAPTNDAPKSFWRADVEEAAGRLAAILQEEGADVLSVYDEAGVTGHPDHIQVHRVGARAAALAGTERVYEMTFDRARARWFFELAVQQGLLQAPLDVDLDRFGMPAERITTVIDVRAYAPLKRRAMAAHASQIGESSFFLALPPDLFAEVWSEECFIRRGCPPGLRETSLFDGLA